MRGGVEYARPEKMRGGVEERERGCGGEREKEKEREIERVERETKRAVIGRKTQIPFTKNFMSLNISISSSISRDKIGEHMRWWLCESQAGEGTRRETEEWCQIVAASPPFLSTSALPPPFPLPCPLLSSFQRLPLQDASRGRSSGRRKDGRQKLFSCRSFSLSNGRAPLRRAALRYGLLGVQAADEADLEASQGWGLVRVTAKRSTG
jgi:hypothetical protein